MEQCLGSDAGDKRFVLTSPAANAGLTWALNGGCSRGLRAKNVDTRRAAQKWADEGASSEERGMRDRETERQRDREAERQRGRETERQRDREAKI